MDKALCDIETKTKNNHQPAIVIKCLAGGMVANIHFLKLKEYLVSKESLFFDKMASGVLVNCVLRAVFQRR
jgi:hypothetical protein